MPAGSNRYTRVAIVLHWLIALIIIGNLAGGLTIDFFSDSADPQVKALAPVIMGLHKAFGITIIALTLARIGWRLGNPPPPLPAHMTPLERGLAQGTHFGLYVLMLAMPLTGWAMSSAHRPGRAVDMFGLFSVPALPAPKTLEGVLGKSHEVLGWVLLAAVVLHVLAAVKHQIFDRDSLLARMLP